MQKEGLQKWTRFVKIDYADLELRAARHIMRQQQPRALRLDSEARRALRDAGIEPPSSDPISELRWIARNNDWYAKTRSQWYWYDLRASAWKHTPQGPLN